MSNFTKFAPVVLELFECFPFFGIFGDFWCFSTSWAAIFMILLWVKMKSKYTVDRGDEYVTTIKVAFLYDIPEKSRFSIAVFLARI